MKPIILISALLALAACQSAHEPRSSASQVCAERGYAKGSTAYAHCMVDERKADELARENAKRMK